MAVNEIPDAGSFDANCESIIRNAEERPELMLHAFADDMNLTTCGIPVGAIALSCTSPIYFLWAVRSERHNNFCYNCESSLLIEVCDDMIERYRKADEEHRGLDPWRLPKLDLGEEE